MGLEVFFVCGRCAGEKFVPVSGGQRTGQRINGRLPFFVGGREAGLPEPGLVVYKLASVVPETCDFPARPGWQKDSATETTKKTSGQRRHVSFFRSDCALGSQQR